MSIVLHPALLPVTVPFVMGLICLLIPRAMDKERGIAAVISAGTTMLLAWQVFDFEYVMIGDNRYFALDGLNRFVLLAVTVFGFLISLYSLGFMVGRERLREYYSYLLWTVAFSCGAVLASDMLVLLVFWGLLGVTLYIMIGLAGPSASAAAKKSLIVIGGSDCLLLLGVVIVWIASGSTRIGGDPLPLTWEGFAACLCFLVAALAKAGAMPVHSWVPDCGAKAVIPVTAFLPASLDKLLGIYLLARIVTDIFEASPAINNLLMLIGAGTIVCAVMMALVQHDLKRLLSYHAVSQVGYMVLGIGTGTPVGMAGALFHMLNNAVYKSCLFLCAGSVEREAGSTELDKLGGLYKHMPITFASCVVASLAISGVPPLNGFVSKWMVYTGVVATGAAGSRTWVIWLAAAMFGSALTLASFAKVLHAVFLRKKSPDLKNRAINEVSPVMWVPMAVLAAACVIFGILWFRLPFTMLIEPAVTGHVEMSSGWKGGPAAVMLIVAYLTGVIAYCLSTARKPRECRTYVGGEILDETHVSGEAAGDYGRDLEVSGVDFYRTIENMTPFRYVYKAAGNKLFDIYDVGTKVVFYIVGLLRSAHTGSLPVYLTWFLAGFLGLLWLLVHGAEIGLK